MTATYKSVPRSQLRKALATDTYSYFCESPIFSRGCSSVQSLQAPKGRLWMASKAFKLQANHETLWAHSSSSTARSKGLGECVWKYEHVRWTPCRFSPRATLAAPKGEWQYTEETPSGTHHGPTLTHLADYSLHHWRDGNAGTTILYHLRVATSVSVGTEAG